MKTSLIEREHLARWPNRMLPGEFVRIGLDDELTYVNFPIIDFFRGPGEPTLGVTLPVIGKHAHTRPDGSHEIYIGTAETRSLVLVSGELMQKLRVGSRSSLSAATEFLRDPKLDFSQDEKVRFRDPKTKHMRDAVFLGTGQKNKRYILSSEQGSPFELPKNRVFKGAEGTAHSPEYKVRHFDTENKKLLWPDFSYRDQGETLSFLNGAALVSSHPNYLKANSVGRVKFLMDYTRTLIKSDIAATEIEHTGAYHFDDIAAAGVGVCRHLSMLLGAALEESGFRSRVMIYTPPDASVGHAWLEVTTSEGLLVVDPAADKIIPWDEIEKMNSSPSSLATEFYRQTGRVAFPEK